MITREDMERFKDDLSTETLIQIARNRHPAHTTHGPFIQRLADRLEELQRILDQRTAG